MREIRVYSININEIDDNIDKYSNDKFIDIAEKLGTVYSLQGFENAFNYEYINTGTDYIRFIEVEV